MSDTRDPHGRNPEERPWAGRSGPGGPGDPGEPGRWGHGPIRPGGAAVVRICLDDGNYKDLTCDLYGRPS
ncbi:hypothetical protein ACFVSQ_20060 [Streptomyces niveus]|uniref:hypothetical protein n=1 Tax=Streptomyces niveus TaxID=193462 RepID=UPI0036EE3D6B